MSRRRPPPLLFIALSMALHAAALALWGFGSGLRQLEQQRAQAAVAARAEAARLAANTPREQVRQEARRQTREVLTRDLQADLARLLTNTSPAAVQQAWPSITNALAPAMAELAHRMADPARSDRELEQDLQNLKREMVRQLRAQLAGQHRTETAQRFEDAVRTRVAPAVADAYRDAIERQVGRSLEREAANVVRNEERLHQRVVGDMRKQADLALAESAQARATLEQAASAAEQGRAPQKELAVVKGSLDRASLRLGNLAKAAGELDPALATAVTAVHTGELARVQLARDAATNAYAQAAALPAEQVRAGATAASDLERAVARIRDTVYAAVDYEAGATARDALREALDAGGPRQLESAFTRRMSTNTLPLLAAQLQAALDTLLAPGSDAAADGDATRHHLSSILAEAYRDTLTPAQPALESMERSLGLHDRPAGPHGPAGQRRLALMTRTFADLLARYADGAMAEAAASAPGERAVTQSLKAMRDEFRRADDPVFARVDEVARQLEQGRTGFFEEGGSPLSIRLQRQDAIDRAQYADYASRSGYRFEQDVYERLTAGMQARAGAEGAPRDLIPAEASGAPPPAASFPATHAARLLVAGTWDGPPVLSVSADAPYVPPFQTIRYMQVPFCPSAIVIDGDLADWAGVPAVELPVSWAAGATPDPAAPTSQLARVAWDHTGLFLSFEVRDPDRRLTAVPHVQFWDGDAVEIHIDGRNRKQRHRTPDWGQQFWVWPRPPDAAGGSTCGEAFWTPDQGWYWAPKGRDFLGQATRIREDGWTLEIHLPLARLRDVPLQPGRLIGLNLAVDTGTHAFYYATGGTAVHPSDHPDTWADAFLAGSDGTLSADPPAGLPPGAFAIGTAVPLRISDADMNLNPLLVDRVMAVADSSSGDSETVILEETGPDTGTFVGILPTAPNTGLPRPGVLAAFEGESVRVHYDDQARANASRAVEIALTIHAAATIASF